MIRFHSFRSLRRAPIASFFLFALANCGSEGDTTVNAVPSSGTLRPLSGDGGTADFGVCGDTKSDVNNCGRCDNACPTYGTCVEGTCACPKGTTECDGVCVDTTSDKEHCGGCGKTCDVPGFWQGAFCAQSVCRRMEIMARDQPGARGIINDSTSLFLATRDGSIVRVEKTGGAPVTIAPTVGAVERLATDASNVYFVGYAGALGRVSKTGGPVTILASAADASSQGAFFHPADLALDGGFVYVISKHDLWRVPTSGGPLVRVANMTGYVGQPSRLITDGTMAYVLDYTLGQIVSVPLAGGAIVHVGGSLNAPLAFAADDAALYVPTYAPVTEDGSRDTEVIRLGKSPAAGGMFQINAEKTSRSYAIAVDATNVYWSSAGGAWAIYRAPKAAPGLAPENLRVASGPERVNDFTLDAASIYWTSPVNGWVMRATPK